MTTNTDVSVDTDDLAAFEQAFSGKATFAEPVETPAPEPEAIADEPEATPEEDTLAETEAAPDDPETPAPKKKQSFQERINEIVAKEKEAVRRAEALEAELATLRAAKEVKETPTETPQTTSAEQEPTPFDLNEDGSEKYPLGEYDPQYSKDITKFTLKSEMARIKADAIAEAETQKAEAIAKTERDALTSSWAAKVELTLETLPDFVEKGQALESTFANIEPEYGEYLASTIMAMDKGPEVLYYLANNIEEAQAIAARGPRDATIALGRLEAKFLDAPEKPSLKVSAAPEPPETRIRGSSPSLQTPVDTDDLDAFENMYYKK